LVVFTLVVVSQGGKSDTSPPTAGEAPAGKAEVERLFRGIPQHRNVLGDAGAPLTMIEFADLQCPFCGEYSRNALPEIVERYVRPGRLRVDLRLLRFIGPDSDRAAQVATAAAAQNRLWQFADLFYRNQGQENSGYVTDGFLRGLARATPGLDVRRAMRRSLQSEPVLARAESEAAHFGVESTPFFLVGRSGGVLEPFRPSALDPGAFAARLDELLRSR
jgi:protein-disulfide isomerase